jgi:hypothetical protein
VFVGQGGGLGDEDGCSLPRQGRASRRNVYPCYHEQGNQNRIDQDPWAVRPDHDVFPPASESMLREGAPKRSAGPWGDLNCSESRWGGRPLGCQIAPNPDPRFASKHDPSDGAETGGAEPQIADECRKPEPRPRRRSRLGRAGLGRRILPRPAGRRVRPAGGPSPGLLVKSRRGRAAADTLNACNRACWSA